MTAWSCMKPRTSACDYIATVKCGGDYARNMYMNNPGPITRGNYGQRKEQYCAELHEYRERKDSGKIRQRRLNISLYKILRFLGWNTTDSCQLYDLCTTAWSSLSDTKVEKLRFKSFKEFWDHCADRTNFISTWNCSLCVKTNQQNVSFFQSPNFRIICSHAYNRPVRDQSYFSIVRSVVSAYVPEKSKWNCRDIRRCRWQNSELFILGG